MNLLILLVGGNPLPNYMAARYVMDCKRQDADAMPPCDDLLLVYSKETEEMAQGIQQVLCKQLPNLAEQHIHKLELESEGRQYKEVRKKISSKMAALEPQTVHLNYTGGTKVMAVAAHDAVSAWADNDSSKVISSYIAPDDFRLRMNCGGCYPTNACSDLRHSIQLSILEMFALHGLDAETLRIKHETSAPHTTDLCRAVLAKSLQPAEEAFFYEWDKWPDEDRARQTQTALAEKLKKTEKDIDSEIDALQMKLIDRCADLPMQVRLTTGIDDGNKRKAWKRHAKYFKGEWLEQYVFECLKDIKDSHTAEGITDLAWNIRYNDNKQAKEREFELDVICMRGLQPYLFTCTTGRTPGEIKHRAFEGLYRGEQFGGAHCKITLVTMADEGAKSMLDRDLLQFNARDNVSILGADDLREDRIEECLRTVLKGEWENAR